MIGLDVQVSRRVNAGLTVDVAIRLDLEIAVLFGPSGAGKSSVLRMIAGLDRPRSGYVRIGEETVFDADLGVNLPLRSRRIGLIFQDDLLFPHRNVLDNIRFGLKGRTRAEVAARVSEIARLCGVESLLERRPSTLSGGECQRVGLARALAPRPRLLLCDEPLSALDLATRSTILDRLKAVQVAESIPILYVTHSPDEAIAIGTRLFRIEAGRIVEAGPPLEVLSKIRGKSRVEGIRNLFHAMIAAHDAETGSTRLAIEGGPDLVVPLDDREVGASVLVSVPADDILIAIGPCGGLSARNRLEGTVDRILSNTTAAEVVVRIGSTSWIASLTASAVSDLGLVEGKIVTIVVKARSCRLIGI